MRTILTLLLSTAIAYAQESYGIKVPEGYVLQVLTATDGRIAKPKHWYYTNEGTPTGWVWTFSAEDPKPKGYETGMRLQMVLKAAEITKKSKEEIANDFINQKRKSIKVINECPTSDFGEFKRKCIEVLEDIPTTDGTKRFRILYSVMWFKNTDIMALSTFGAPEIKWNSVIEISKVMSEFMLIGKSLGKEQ